MTEQNNEIVIFKNKDGSTRVEVKLQDETVWLTQSQIATLFDKDRTVITKHISNILKDDELEDSVCAKFAHTGPDGKTYQTNYYNLDMIISVGYRVNSRRGIEFRRWASNVLKEYLVQGYSINQQKIDKKQIKELRQTIELLSNTLVNHDLIDSSGKEILKLISSYNKTWDLLIKYDEDRLELPKDKQDKVGKISYSEAVSSINSLKQELGSKGEQVQLFGNEKDNSLKGILGSIYQTFDGVELYASLEEKAANLLYFVIKDHPFSDGNKRIGSFLFLMLLQKNIKLIRAMPDPETITATALLIAESRPDQKDLVTRLVVNLLMNE